MSTPNGGFPPPPPPPGGTPPPPPSFGGTPPPAGGAPAAPTKSSLPLWSLITGVASFLCLPVILAVVAIITGFIGRGRAKAEGNSTGMATAGILLGVANIVLTAIATVLAVVLGIGVFNTVSNQVTIARSVVPAVVAAETYGIANGSYAGLTTDELTAYGFTPSADVTVTAVSLDGGTDFCVEGYANSDPSRIIHMPVTSSDFSTMTLELNGESLSYGTGPCPVR